MDTPGVGQAHDFTRHENYIQLNSRLTIIYVPFTGKNFDLPGIRLLAGGTSSACFTIHISPPLACKGSHKHKHQYQHTDIPPFDIHFPPCIKTKQSVRLKSHSQDYEEDPRQTPEHSHVITVLQHHLLPLATGFRSACFNSSISLSC